MRGLLIALGLLLALTWIGGGYALYTVIRDDDAQVKKTSAVSVQLADATRRYMELEADNAKTVADLKAAQTEAQHPTLGIWNVHETISGPSAYLTGGIPDTFTYHLKFTSDAPVTVPYLTNRYSLPPTESIPRARAPPPPALSRRRPGCDDLATSTPATTATGRIPADHATSPGPPVAGCSPACVSPCHDGTAHAMSSVASTASARAATRAVSGVSR